MASDLISREASVEYLRRDFGYHFPLYDGSRLGTTQLLVTREDVISAILHNIPAVDAVEVVRCKDCVHAVSTTNSALIKTFGEDVKVCNIHRGTLCFGAYIVSNEGFCSDGERKECVYAVD